MENIPTDGNALTAAATVPVGWPGLCHCAKHSTPSCEFVKALGVLYIAGSIRVNRCHIAVFPVGLFSC